MKTELELRQLFKNLSDCYADTGWLSNGKYIEGPLVQAMTEDTFIKLMMEIVPHREEKDSNEKHTK